MKGGIILFFLLSISIIHCYPQESDLKTDAQSEELYASDFGKVKEGEILQHTFTLKNNSAKKLTIENLITSCACTSAKIKDNVLFPGQGTAIEVAVDTKGYSGSLEQYVYVYTDNSDNSPLRFTLKADVTP